MPFKKVEGVRDYGIVVAAVTLSMTALALVIALGRFYTRAIMLHSWGKDDSCIVFSMVRCSHSNCGGTMATGCEGF